MYTTGIIKKQLEHLNSEILRLENFARQIHPKEVTNMELLKEEKREMEMLRVQDDLFSCTFSYIKGSLNISAHLSMKTILVDPNLAHTFWIIILLILIMVCTFKNNYFLVRTN